MKPATVTQLGRFAYAGGFAAALDGGTFQLYDQLGTPLVVIPLARSRAIGDRVVCETPLQAVIQASGQADNYRLTDAAGRVLAHGNVGLLGTDAALELLDLNVEQGGTFTLNALEHIVWASWGQTTSEVDIDEPADEPVDEEEELA